MSSTPVRSWVETIQSAAQSRARDALRFSSSSKVRTRPRMTWPVLNTTGGCLSPNAPPSHPPPGCWIESSHLPGAAPRSGVANDLVAVPHAGRRIPSPLGSRSSSPNRRDHVLECLSQAQCRRSERCTAGGSVAAISSTRSRQGSRRARLAAFRKTTRKLGGHRLPGRSSGTSFRSQNDQRPYAPNVSPDGI